MRLRTPIQQLNTLKSVFPTSGGIAQLGERLNGIQEVSGSIPLISTISREKHLKILFRKERDFFMRQSFLYPALR